MRKLLPESWGFLCPVHTPDGSPCGLLNHFAAACRVVTEQPDLPEDIRHAIAQASFNPAPLFSHCTHSAPCKHLYRRSPCRIILLKYPT